MGNAQFYLLCDGIVRKLTSAEDGLVTVGGLEQAVIEVVAIYSVL